MAERDPVPAEHRLTFARRTPAPQEFDVDANEFMVGDDVSMDGKQVTLDLWNIHGDKMSIWMCKDAALEMAQTIVEMVEEYNAEQECNTAEDAA